LEYDVYKKAFIEPNVRYGISQTDIKQSEKKELWA